MDTVTNSLTMDGLVAGDFPLAKDTVTVKIGQNLTRGTVVGKEDGTSATKTATNDGPYDMAAGDTLVVNIDGGGNETITFDAAAGSATDTTTYTGGTAASVTDTTSYAVADQDTKTEKFTIDGGAEQTVTFAGSTTTALQVAAQINAQLTGASANVVGGQVVVTSDSVGVDSSIVVGTGTCDLIWDTPVAGSGGLADQDGLTEVFTIDGGDAQTVTFVGASTATGKVTEAADIASQINSQLVGASAAVVAGQVKVTSDTKGTGSTVAIGTGTCALSWGTPVAGTGDCVNIDAVTVAEVKTVVEADTTGATVTAVGSAFKIESDSVGTSSTVQFVSGNLLTVFGFSAETVTGTGGSGHSIICNKNGDDGSEDPQAVLAEDCNATAAAKTCAVYRTGTFSAAKLTFASGTVAADMEEKMAAKGMFQVTTASM